MELMYLQNDKTDVLEVLEIKIFFVAQPWWKDVLRIFIKFSPRVLDFWHLCNFIEKQVKNL